MNERIGFLAALLLTGLVAVACTSKPPARLPSPAWRVEVAGCETWQVGPTCALPAGEGELKIWIGPRQEEIAIELDGRRLEVPFVRKGDGIQITLTVAAKNEPQRLRLGTKPGDSFEIDLVSSRRPGWYSKVHEFLSQGDQDGAERFVAAQNDHDRAWKTYLQARLALRRGQRSQTRARLEEALVFWRATEIRSQEVNDAALLAQLFAGEASYPESRDALSKAERALLDLRGAKIDPVRPLYLVTFAKAKLAYLTGDLRGALAELDAIEVLWRHGVLSSEERSESVQLQAVVLGELGQFEMAAALLEELPILEDEAEEARRQVNQGWIALLEKHAGRPGKDPRPYFEAAWSYFSRTESDHQKLNTQINLAATALLEGRLDEAKRCLDAAAAWREQGLAIEKFMFDELQARILLLEGQKQAALEAFERLDNESSRQHLPGARWQALVGKAETLARLGRKNDARATYSRAEQLARTELLLIPLHRGRESFLARREKATRQHLELLLEDGREREAFEVVRQYRKGALALLERDEKLLALDPEARRRWDDAVAKYHQELAAYEVQTSALPDPVGSESRDAGAASSTSDTLSALFDSAWATLGLLAPEDEATRQPGELQLAFFPRERSWLIFALDGEGRLEIAEKVVAPGTELPAVAADLLQLVAPQIRAAEKLKILPWGDLDFHALPFDGQPLLVSKRLSYGVDAGRAAAPGRRDSARSALLVGNPGQNLLWTGVEIELALNTLGHLGNFAPPIHLIGIRARGAAVRDALEKVDFFHFAGHGHFDQKGSQSRLSLAGGELRVGDVLTLRQAPEQVLLSSCSVGRATRAAGVEGLGLANAFVLAGSRQVLAATREVNDRQTAELARSLYSHIAASPGEIDLVTALRQAQLDWIAARPNDDAWKAFRVFEP